MNKLYFTKLYERLSKGLFMRKSKWRKTEEIVLFMFGLRVLQVTQYMPLKTVKGVDEPLKAFR